MKDDKECEQHNCEALKYCKWHPDNCQGKPSNNNPELKRWKRILRPACFGKEPLFSGCGREGKCPFGLEIECGTETFRDLIDAGKKLEEALRKGGGAHCV